MDGGGGSENAALRQRSVLDDIGDIMATWQARNGVYGV